MRLDPARSQDEITRELARLDERAWGQSDDPLRKTLLENAGRALWRIAQEPLGALEVEPDFIDHEPEQLP